MSLSKMLQEYREGLRGLPTYEELAAIASSAPMTPERFSEKMDALDKVNPEPLARLMATTEQCADTIVERNVSLLRQRSAVGVQKYGTTLADNKLPLRAWLNHALEEALDQANYLQAAMAEIDSAERSLPPLPQYFPDVTNIRADEELRAQQYAQDYARSALADSPVWEQNPAAVVYPPDGTVSPFTVINLGHGLVKMGDSLHDGRLPALWFGKDGLGMGVAEEMNRAAKEGETLAVVTFSNVDGLDVLAEVVQRIRSVAFPAAPAQPVAMPDETVLKIALQALSEIRTQGWNFTDWAIWAQKMAAWGMAPNKWPKPMPYATAVQGDAMTEREKFEKHFGPKDNFCWRNDDDTYKNSSTQQAWTVWQAAIAAKEEPAPQ